MIAFGPVPSRRLGRSLGVNNIPPKICSYACAYCQLGRTLKLQARRQAFYKPEMVWASVQDKVAKARQAGETIDYLTFVPDGEPTLDINLKPILERLKALNLPIAVITNASLIWRQDVREDLLNANWVSLKIDTVEEETWRRVNHPHKSLALTAILEGALEFATVYEGTLATETMLVAGVNDSEDQVAAVADYLARLQPSVAYLSIPTRPPAKKWVSAPDEKILNRAYQCLREKVQRAEYLIGYEGNAFAFTGDVEQDLLSITAVHPMRQDAVNEYLTRAGGDWAVVGRLLEEGKLIETKYGTHRFYLRTLRIQGKEENDAD
ncbi:radical SAM domain protein [Desulfosarcina variabilis str. Montpellier]|uniref:radical SAM protein n=1 Tax=Desulfosarcina variabilis TaxID=2300 RepID=UPI003AFAE3BD